MRPWCRDSLWAYAAQTAGLAMGAALVPVVLWRLSLEQVALWYLMLAAVQFASLAEGALEPSVTRYLRYAHSGVTELPVHGQPAGPGSGRPDAAVMAELASAAHRLYRFLAWANLGGVGILGALGLVWLGRPLGDWLQVLSAWGLCALAQWLGCRWFVAVPLLQGCARPDLAFQALTRQRLAFGTVAALGLLALPRLEMLGLAQIVAALAGPGWAIRQVRHRLSAAAARPAPDHLRMLLQGALALWLGRVGGYLVVKANLPIVSASLGLQAAGRLALALQLIEAISQIAQAPLMARLPQLCAWRTLDKSGAFKASVGRVLSIGWLTYVGGATALWVLGPPLLAALGKAQALPPALPLALLLLAGLLELNHSMSGTLLMVDNRVPFVPAALLSGAAIVVLSIGVLRFESAGLAEVVAVPLLVQACYNNWKWPLECLRAFNTSYAELVRAAWRKA